MDAISLLEFSQKQIHADTLDVSIVVRHSTEPRKKSKTIINTKKAVDKYIEEHPHLKRPLRTIITTEKFYSTPSNETERSNQDRNSETSAE